VANGRRGNRKLPTASTSGTEYISQSVRISNKPTPASTNRKLTDKKGNQGLRGETGSGSSAPGNGLAEDKATAGRAKGYDDAVEKSRKPSVMFSGFVKMSVSTASTSLNLVQYPTCIGKRSLTNLDMFARPQVIRDNYASQCRTKKVLTTFSRRITGREGSIESFTSHFVLYETALARAWIPSSISRLIKDCFSRCTSLTSVTFESNSKLQRIEESAFAQSGLTTIEVPASVEVLCKLCFSYCWSLTSVTFELNSKLQRFEE
jgi:hypothetical protein